jgi:transposase
MPRPLPVPIRQAIWRRFQDGQNGPDIATALGLAPRTVRHLLRRFRRGGPDALFPSYDRCGEATRKPAESVLQAALGLRQEHPTWGAGLIRVMLRRQQLNLSPPAERTLQRWFLRAGLAPAKAGRRPATDSRRAERPHQVWQMDAAELVKLRTGQRVCWLRIADECSGAVLWTAVFPPGPVDPSPADGGPSPTSLGLRPLGPPRAVPCGQRRPVGLMG